MGRASLKDAVENRSRVVKAASSLIRQNGVDGLHIDKLMAEAGLTRGGFYKMFGSKDALNAEACTSAFEGATKSWETILAGTEKGRLRRLADYYFEPKPAGSQCPLAALSGDAARAPVTARSARPSQPDYASWLGS